MLRCEIFALRRSPHAGEERETGSCCLQDCIRRHAHIRERIYASPSGWSSHEICFASISFEREIANGCCDHISLSPRRGRSPSVFNHSLDPVQPRRTLSFQRLLKNKFCYRSSVGIARTKQAGYCPATGQSPEKQSCNSLCTICCALSQRIRWYIQIC